MLAQRGIGVSYETVRCWTIKFGPQIAANLRQPRAPPSPRWHLDEMVCNIGGERVYLWRAVDDEGEVLDLVVQKGRNTTAALKLLKRLLRNQGVEPESFVTDCLKFYGSALRVLGLEDRHRPGRLRENNRAENSHLPIRRRERKMQGFKSLPSAQRFLTTHAKTAEECHILSAARLRSHRLCDGYIAGPFWRTGLRRIWMQPKKVRLRPSRSRVNRRRLKGFDEGDRLLCMADQAKPKGTKTS